MDTTTKADEMVAVVVGSGLVEVMQLDDSGMVKSYDIRVDYPKKGCVMITATRAAMTTFLDAVNYRDSNGWDQPVWYRNSARAAAKKIKERLAAK